MRFGQPLILYLYILVAGLVVLLWWAGRQRRKLFSTWGDLSLLERLTQTINLKSRRWKSVLLITGAGLLVFAAARPQYGQRLTYVKREGIDLLVAVDVSASMLAEDVKPNRLELARRDVAGLINRLQGDRIGLLAFAGVAFVQCPLTLDYGAAKLFLDVLNPNLIPEPGTAIGEAIRTAQQAFVQKERKYKVLILITDGEDHDTDPIGAAKEAAREGIRIYTIGMGSSDGEPIPLRGPNGQLIGYKKDESGQVVVSRLDETTLQKIALETNGKYYRGTTGGLELDHIYDEIAKMEKKGLKGEYQTQYEDRYQYPLFLGLLLVLVEFILPERRKIQPEVSESVKRLRMSQ